MAVTKSLIKVISKVERFHLACDFMIGQLIPSDLCGRPHVIMVGKQRDR